MSLLGSSMPDYGAASTRASNRTSPGQSKNWFSNLFSGSGGSSGGGGSGSDWLGAGLTLLGGFIDQRGDDKTNRRALAAAAQLGRENMMANRAGDREGLRVSMQRDQDTSAREIMRNRAAIAPWGERYRGPAFTQANPNAPIYNPLMEQGHIYGELSQPLQGPPGWDKPWNGT